MSTPAPARVAASAVSAPVPVWLSFPAEDGLFRALCRIAYGDGVQLEVPFSIGHRQEAGRDRSELFSRPVNMDVNYCFTELAQHVADDLYATSPVLRWAVYAGRLEDIALGSDEVLVNYLREFLVYKRSLLIEQLQRVAESSADMPQAWREDVVRLIQINGKAVFERATPVYAGWNPESTAEDCAAAFRAEARLICAGLRAWPQAWALAEHASSRTG